MDGAANKVGPRSIVLTGFEHEGERIHLTGSLRRGPFNRFRDTVPVLWDRIVPSSRAYRG